MASSYPFVIFKVKPTANIGLTPTAISDSVPYTSLIDGILLVNMTPGIIKVTLPFKRTLSSVMTETIFRNQIVLQANEAVDVQMEKALTIEPTDVLMAFSNYTANLFNTFVTYRILTELPASTSLRF